MEQIQFYITKYFICVFLFQMIIIITFVVQCSSSTNMMMGQQQQLTNLTIVDTSTIAAITANATKTSPTTTNTMSNMKQTSSTNGIRSKHKYNQKNFKPKGSLNQWINHISQAESKQRSLSRARVIVRVR